VLSLKNTTEDNACHTLMMKVMVALQKYYKVLPQKIRMC
jgi:hypothetical protein